ncbi:MAG: hypothetical protein WCI74_15910 [Actinomycetes bacterium]
MTNRRGVLAASIVLILSAWPVAGCSSSSSSQADGSGAPAAIQGAAASESGATVVSKYDVTSNLQPLTKAVVAYTSATYAPDGASPYTAQVLSKIQANYGEIQTQEDVWRQYVGQIDYSSSGIAGLQGAIDDFNAGLDAWQAQQDKGMVVWDRCVGQGGGDLQISTCMVSSYPMTEEQAVLTSYTTPLKALMALLGIPTQ